jgi:hypothetical protein
MRPRDLIRIRKVVSKAGDWKVVTGKSGMTAASFPISKSYGVLLGRNWHWRSDAVEGNGMAFRILTAFHPGKEEYKACMVVPRGNQHVVVASLEFHGDHPGWHCHLPCCDLDDVEAGQGHPRSANRLPAAVGNHRRMGFGMTESAALAKSFEFFRVTGTPKGHLI